MIISLLCVISLTFVGTLGHQTKQKSHYSQEILISSRPPGASETFDCKLKKLAYEYAKKLQADSNKLKFVFHGLELDSKCNETELTNLPRKRTMEFLSQSSTSHRSLGGDDIYNEFQVYVDVNSNQLHMQSADGSYSNPFPQIQLGINRCADLNLSHGNSKCTVLISKGNYVVFEALKVQSSNIHLVAEKGTIVTSDVLVNNLVWNEYKSFIDLFINLNPIFEGIVPKQSTHAISYVGMYQDEVQCREYCIQEEHCTSFVFFDNSTEEYADQCYIRKDGMWNTVNRPGVKSGKKVLIYMTDLKEVPNLNKVDQIFINDRRAIRARFPNANPETMGLHTVPSGYVNNAQKWFPPLNHSEAMEVHIETPLREASLFPKFSVGIDGSVKQFSPPESYWGMKNPFGGGGATYKVPTGLQYSDDLEINQRSWKNPKTGIIHAFQSYHWGNWMFKLDHRNKENCSLNWTWGGFQEARGSDEGKEWYVENIFEELDSPNEWFFDEEQKILYYSPNLTENNLPEQISIPQLPCLLIISGEMQYPVVNVSVAGIIFKHSTQTFLEPYMVPSGGDWSVHPNGVVFIKGTENVFVNNCLFNSPGGNGIFVRNYNRDLVISDNILFRLGDNGIVLVGDTHLIDGTAGNQPRRILVEKNVIFENGIWGKQTYAFVQSISCEVTLDGNIFFNGPRAGININDGFGGGNIISNSLLFNFVRETDDHGPINTWDRIPYLTRVYDGLSPSLRIKENEIHYNFIINNYRSVWPIDHDDGSCYWNDTHNYMVYGGFKNYLGHDKRSVSNIYVYPDMKAGENASMTSPHCLQTAGQTLGTSGYGDVFSNNKCISERSDIYDLGDCQPEHLSMLIPYLSDNFYYTKNGEIIATCGSEKWNLTEIQKHGMELGTIVETLADDDAVIRWGKDLLNI